jgi:hypothetical protein
MAFGVKLTNKRVVPRSSSVVSKGLGEAGKERKAAHSVKDGHI